MSALPAYCLNADRHDGRQVPKVADLTFPGSHYVPTTACAGCLHWSVQQARIDGYAVTVTPVSRPEATP
jgi:hypothetical protein